MVQAFLSKILGTRNQRILKKYKQTLFEINALEEKYSKLSDDELRISFLNLKEETKEKYKSEGLKALDLALPQSFAITREVSFRILKMRHFDVQIIGGIVLHQGKIAEMKTGEGKTLVATLPVVLNAMLGKGVHIVTANDYLAKRDAKDMNPIYDFLGYSVGVITSDNMDDDRTYQYNCDIIYGTNNEFGFDYLRDNMKYSLSSQLQKEHFFAIIDEVDSILIDEARTPLIISGPMNKKLENYGLANSIAQKLEKDKDFNVDEKNRVVLITEEGIRKAESLFKVDNLYNIENAILVHHLDQALKANYLFIKDKDYVVKDNEVIIVDEFTGRLGEGRRFSEGLHQAIEAKEMVEIKAESQTLANITFQNFFRMYEKLSGMTGTAQTEATEFLQIYKLDVVSIPTNIPCQRKDHNDLIFKSEDEKFEAVKNKVIELHKKGVPILIGTASIEKSEKLHAILKKSRIPHTILNAKHHYKEAEIIKDAGKLGSVTISTNMAGRGVDIRIEEDVRNIGGLYIIGTERHESRRIDNQLRGRSGRQGDPGQSQFYLSLEDDLLRIFGSHKIKKVMERLGLKDGEHIESRLVTRSIANAQKKVEGMHFESRKHTLEYDDVANEQRKVIYKFRNKLLNEENDLGEKIIEDRIFSVNYLTKDYLNLEDVDLKGFESKILEDFGVKIHINVDSKDSIFKIEDLRESVISQLKKSYDEKMKNLSDVQRKEIERIIYLQVLDNSWREHLYTMDHLKTGIGLRGYNQKDPLVEYKKESYYLFLELTSTLKLEACKMLHIVKLREHNNDDESKAREMLHSLEKSSNSSLTLSRDEYFTHKEKKILRNEPCPCGSGKKYKICHGRSGPKQGMLSNNYSS